MVWWGDGVDVGGPEYSAFRDALAGGRRGQSKPGENVLSDSQSVLSGYEPESTNGGGGQDSLFELSRFTTL